MHHPQIEGSLVPAADQTGSMACHPRAACTGPAPACFAGRRGQGVRSVRPTGRRLKTLALMIVIALMMGCAATGPQFDLRELASASDAQIVVFRISQVGGKAGSWVPMRVEVNGVAIGKLPDGSFLALGRPEGSFTLSVTAMVNFRYSDAERVTLHHEARKGEVAYFRIESVFGRDCSLVSEHVDGPETAHATYYPRRDSPQTVCVQRVPEPVALRALANLRRAN